MKVFIHFCYRSGKLPSILFYWSSFFVSLDKTDEQTNMTNIYFQSFIAIPYHIKRNTNCLASWFCFEYVTPIKKEFLDLYNFLITSIFLCFFLNFWDCLLFDRFFSIFYNLSDIQAYYWLSRVSSFLAFLDFLGFLRFPRCSQMSCIFYRVHQKNVW